MFIIEVQLISRIWYHTAKLYLFQAFIELGQVPGFDEHVESICHGSVFTLSKQIEEYAALQSKQSLDGGLLLIIPVTAALRERLTTRFSEHDRNLHKTAMQALLARIPGGNILKR
jgi:hypothetical protein